MADQNPLPIHTSDRINFKKCRRSWNWASKLGRNLTAVKAPVPLSFGTAIHAGVEVWYDPLTWHGDREVVALAAVQRFREVHKETRDTYLKHVGREHLSEEDEEEYKDLLKLGVGMLENYFTYSERVDEGWEPVGVEVPFEIPIKIPTEWMELPEAFSNVDGCLYYNQRPVVYRGRIDLIMRDPSGRIWLWDHKTAARFEDNVDFLELDEQMGSYGWAYRELAGKAPHGIMYSELYKGIPEPPKELDRPRKGCMFSVSRSQDTSYELLLATVQQYDRVAYNQGLYDDVLQFFKAEGKQYFRRTTVLRNDHEYDALGEQIAWEAIDMLDQPRLYPNPSRFGCRWCMFRLPCLAKNDGSDFEGILRDNYRERDDR